MARTHSFLVAKGSAHHFPKGDLRSSHSSGPRRSLSCRSGPLLLAGNISKDRLARWAGLGGADCAFFLGVWPRKTQGSGQGTGVS